MQFIKVTKDQYEKLLNGYSVSIDGKMETYNTDALYIVDGGIPTNYLNIMSKKGESILSADTHRGDLGIDRFGDHARYNISYSHYNKAMSFNDGTDLHINNGGDICLNGDYLSNKLNSSVNFDGNTVITTDNLPTHSSIIDSDYGTHLLDHELYVSFTRRSSDDVTTTASYKEVITSASYSASSISFKCEAYQVCINDSGTKFELIELDPHSSSNRIANSDLAYNNVYVKYALTSLPSGATTLSNAYIVAHNKALTGIDSSGISFASANILVGGVSRIFILFANSNLDYDDSTFDDYTVKQFGQLIFGFISRYSIKEDSFLTRTTCISSIRPMAASIITNEAHLTKNEDKAYDCANMYYTLDSSSMFLFVASLNTLPDDFRRFDLADSKDIYFPKIIRRYMNSIFGNTLSSGGMISDSAGDAELYSQSNGFDTYFIPESRELFVLVPGLRNAISGIFVCNNQSLPPFSKTDTSIITVLNQCQTSYAAINANTNDRDGANIIDRACLIDLNAYGLYSYVTTAKQAADLFKNKIADLYISDSLKRQSYKFDGDSFGGHFVRGIPALTDPYLGQIYHITSENADVVWNGYKWTPLTGGTIETIHTQIVRLWDLPVGIYKLTYSGNKILDLGITSGTTKYYTLSNTNEVLLEIWNVSRSSGYRKCAKTYADDWPKCYLFYLDSAEASGNCGGSYYDISPINYVNWDVNVGNIFAPTANGNAGTVLLANGGNNKPTWSTHTTETSGGLVNDTSLTLKTTASGSTGCTMAYNETKDCIEFIFK